MNADHHHPADPLALHDNFNSLSLVDLLDARDSYHFDLLNKANVVGTAVGLYRIRKDEEWPDRKGGGTRLHRSEPREIVDARPHCGILVDLQARNR